MDAIRILLEKLKDEPTEQEVKILIEEFKNKFGE